MHVYLHVWTHVCIHVLTHVFVHVYTHVYTHMPTACRWCPCSLWPGPSLLHLFLSISTRVWVCHIGPHRATAALLAYHAKLCALAAVSCTRSCGADGAACVWSMPSGGLLSELRRSAVPEPPPPGVPTTCCAVTTDGSCAATAFADGKVQSSVFSFYAMWGIITQKIACRQTSIHRNTKFKSTSNRE